MYSAITSNKRKSVLLMMVFIIIIILIGFTFSYINGDPTYSGVWLAIILALLMTSVSYFRGDKIALRASGAKPLKREDNLYLYRMVENLCITSGQPTPQVYIIEDPAINAFATGRKPELASVAVTKGALEKLENEELEGVLAHEMSHIKNYDIRFMMLVAVLVGSIAILTDIFLRWSFFGGRSRRNNNGGGNIGAILMIVGIILAVLSPLIAELIKLAISRKREFLADASGSLLTRYPEGLARALEKIEADGLAMQKKSHATAHMFLFDPYQKKARKKKSWFSTHPPVQERVKRLRMMGE